MAEPVEQHWPVPKRVFAGSHKCFAPCKDSREGRACDCLSEGEAFDLWDYLNADVPDE